MSDLHDLNAHLVWLKLKPLTDMCDVTDPNGAYWANNPEEVMSSLKATIEAARLAVIEVNSALGNDDKKQAQYLARIEGKRTAVNTCGLWPCPVLVRMRPNH